MAGIRYGVARGIFSNEAGLGTAGIAQAAGYSASPVHSGLIGMMGTFFDTIVVCSMTGLAIVVSGVWTSGETGAVLTQLAFQSRDAGHRRRGRGDRARGLRPHHHLRLELLRRALLELPARAEVDPAVPRAVDAGGVRSAR